MAYILPLASNDEHFHPFISYVIIYQQMLPGNINREATQSLVNVYKSHIVKRSLDIAELTCFAPGKACTPLSWTLYTSWGWNLYSRRTSNKFPENMLTSATELHGPREASCRQELLCRWGPNWVGTTWKRRQNPVSETLCAKQKKWCCIMSRVIILKI
jgi:hypothetical protein